MREMIKHAFILGLVCFLSSGLLAAVNEATQQKITEQKEEGIKEALKEIMPQGNNFKPQIKDEKVIYYSVYDKKNKLIGFALKTVKKGYSSDIELLAGLNSNLEIANIKILSQNETPGLGNRISEPAFQEQFKGKNLDNFAQVQAITGATVSSKAVIDSIKDKILELKDELTKKAGHG